MREHRSCTGPRRGPVQGGKLLDAEQGQDRRDGYQVAPSDVHLFWQGLAPTAKFPGAVGEFTIFYVATDATDDDGVRGEGAAMQFVEAATVARLEFDAAYAAIVPRFLASPQYRAMVSA